MLNEELQHQLELLGRRMWLSLPMHSRCCVSASARQRSASLQDLENLCAKSGNCDPEGGELREGLPPEDVAEISRKTRGAD